MLVDCDRGTVDLVSEDSGRMCLLAPGPFLPVWPCVVFDGPASAVVTIISVGSGGLSGARPRNVGLYGDGGGRSGAGTYGASDGTGASRSLGGGGGGGGCGGGGGEGGGGGGGGDRRGGADERGACGGGEGGGGGAMASDVPASRVALPNRITMVFASPYAEYDGYSGNWKPLAVCCTRACVAGGGVRA